MGDRFGPYELLEPLAAGGMARVFRARMAGALGFEKIVAVKFMLPGFAADPTAVKMFVDEARLAATLTHANIVGILDFGERGGEHYIAMEYVSGANVRVLVKRTAETRRLPSPALAAYIVSEAARGLEYAHGKTDTEGRLLNIVHRDVSPQNIVVSWEGEVKILDFGIARSRQRSFETAVGTIKGKYAYMSPEQASGMPVDQRSDLFSLGAVLYELLTAEKAFPQPGVAALDKVRRAEFVPPENLRPGLPHALLAILSRALSRDPEQRYLSASGMLDDLRLYLAEERARSGTTVDAATLANWAQDLFEVSDSDIAVDGPALDLPAPKGPEPGLLPGWGETDDSNVSSAANPPPTPAPRRPAPTSLASLTFSGSDEIEAPQETDDVTMVTLQPMAPEPASPPGWVLPGAAATPPSAPSGFAPLPVPPVPAVTPPPASAPLPSTPPPAEPVAPIPAAPPIASPSVERTRPNDRPSSAARERASRTGAVAPRNAPATTPPAEVPRAFDLRSPVILFLGGLTGAGLMTGVFLFGFAGRPEAPTPTPTPTAIPSPIATEELVVETPIAVVDTQQAIAISDDPFAARPGEKKIGLLSIASEPPRGQVLIDGKAFADLETPALLPNIPVPRRYVVEIRHDGHFPWSREVDVLDDESLQVVAKLVPIDVPGQLKVRVPKGGTAFVDGRLAAKGPTTVTVQVSPGQHQLRLKDDNGLIAREYEVLVARGRVTEIDLPPP